MLLNTLLFVLFFYIKFAIFEQHPFVVEANIDQHFEPNWESLDKRPLPKWYDEAKIGIFIHWGVFSVPSFSSEWFWANWKGGNKDIVQFMKDNYRPNFPYQNFGSEFTAEFYNPNEWAELFKKSGAKYIVLTSKHHEGFTLWPSKHSFGWNAMDIGPHRDVLGDLAKAVRAQNLTFGLYHSLFEWFNPMYLSDKANNFKTNEYVMKKMLPEMHELINTYQPLVLWSDGDWEAYDTYFNSTNFLAWLYNESPVKDNIVVNDRWGISTSCKHGDFYSCQDRYNPGVLQKHKWENAMTIDKKSWGFRRNANLSNYLTAHELIETLAQTISCGGNILINVGPTKEGVINPIFEERLLQLGQWLEINGEAIYGSKPWIHQNDTLTPGVWYTQKGDNVYGIVLNWPKNNILKLGSVKNVTGDLKIVLLENKEQNLKYKVDEGHIAINFPDKATVSSNEAWVFKLNY